MLRRKYELEEKHVYKLCEKQPKTVLNNLKSNYGKYHREWCFNRRQQLKYSYQND